MANKIHAAGGRLEEARMLESGVVEEEEQLGGDSPKYILFRAMGVLAFYYLVIVIVFGYFDGWAHSTEGHTWVKMVDAIYFASTTLSTVGYGDILPTRDETRMVTTLVLLLAFTFILREFNLLTEMWMEKVQERNQKMMAKLAASLDEDGDGVVEASELGALGCVLAACTPRVTSAVAALAGLTLNVAMGTFVLVQWEGLDVVTGVYTSLVTMTTVGYGDFSFSKPGTRMFASLWLIVAPVATGLCFNTLLAAIMDTDGRLDRKRKQLLEAPVTVATFSAMDVNGDGSMSEAEFVIARLITMKMLGNEALPMVQRLKETFQSIDADRSGHVQISEILAAQKKKAAPRASPSQQQWSAAE